MSDDILSGGRIDESTSGPNPPKMDDRGRDILLEQKERQDQDAIGGTQLPPSTQPLPLIPEAIEVAPQLPIVPFFDFSSSSLEGTREIARQAVIDVLKNVTINGQGPSIDGSSVSFNFSREPAASEVFASRGSLVLQAIPESLVTPPPVTLRPPQPQPETQIQSFEITPTDVGQVTTSTVLPEVSIPVGTDNSIVPPPQESPVFAPSAPPATASITPPETETQETPRTRQPTPEASDSSVERIVSRIPENEPVTPTAIRSALREEGFQTTQRAWSNYIDPQAVKDAIEGREEARKESNIKIGEALEVTGGRDEEKIKDYYAGNTPFPPLIPFQVCVGNKLKTFLIPAFGPY